MAEKWIQKALPPSSRGKLHKELGIKKGEKIPAKKLAKAASKGGKIGRQARLAETLKKLSRHHGARKT